MRVLGIMSGTSIDGVDYVICEISSPGRPRFIEHWSASFPRGLQARLHRAARNEGTSHELGDLHHDLGRFYARAARDARVSLVGLHGQTVFHNPAKSSLQIGEPAYLAEQLGVPVISNFRAADIAAGGQGAPLATIFHRHVFASPGKHVAVNNLGGISNVTSLDWRKGKAPRVLAFDTGPGNMLLDMAARRFWNKPFDRDGKAAARGTVDNPALKRFLKHPFFSQTPPKSTGRELFGEPFFAAAQQLDLAPLDLLATVTELTAACIALNYERHLPSVPDVVILAGGGSRNRYLAARIHACLARLNPRIAVHTSSDYGWDPEVIEASAFALLAWLTWHRQPGNLPATTGAKGPRVLGQVTASVPQQIR